MKAAKIILIVLFGIKAIVDLAKAIGKGKLLEVIGTLMGIGTKAYLYYLVGIFNL